MLEIFSAPAVFRGAKDYNSVVLCSLCSIQSSEGNLFSFVVITIHILMVKEINPCWLFAKLGKIYKNVLYKVFLIV